jgi:hypothetical protein
MVPEIWSVPVAVVIRIIRERRKRTKCEYPYARAVGVAKKGIPTVKTRLKIIIHGKIRIKRKIQVYQIEQDSNFGGDTARKIIIDYKSKQRKSSCHVR